MTVQASQEDYYSSIYVYALDVDTYGLGNNITFVFTPPSGNYQGIMGWGVGAWYGTGGPHWRSIINSQLAHTSYMEFARYCALEIPINATDISYCANADPGGILRESETNLFKALNNIPRIKVSPGTNTSPQSWSRPFMMAVQDCGADLNEVCYQMISTPDGAVFNLANTTLDGLGVTIGECVTLSLGDCAYDQYYHLQHACDNLVDYWQDFVGGMDERPNGDDVDDLIGQVATSLDNSPLLKVLGAAPLGSVNQAIKSFSLLMEE